MNVRHAIPFSLLLVIPVGGWAQAVLTPEQKVGLYTKSVVGPVALVSVAFSSGLNQWRDVPHAWGQGAEGYAVRFASVEGYNVANNSIALGLNLSLHLDPRYRRMPEAGFGARVKNALSQTAFANKDSGGRMVNVSVLGGSYGAAFIGNAWQPSRENGVGDALMRGTLTLAFHAGKNAVHEFLPDLFGHFRHKQPVTNPRTNAQ